MISLFDALTRDFVGKCRLLVNPIRARIVFDCRMADDAAMMSFTISAQVLSMEIRAIMIRSIP